MNYTFNTSLLPASQDIINSTTDVQLIQMYCHSYVQNMPKYSFFILGVFILLDMLANWKFHKFKHSTDVMVYMLAMILTFVNCVMYAIT